MAEVNEEILEQYLCREKVSGTFSPECIVTKISLSMFQYPSFEP